jgi:DNA-binding FadR family transcriptional regulator
VISFRLSDDNPQGQSHSLPLHQQVVESMANRDSAGANKALVSLLDGTEEGVPWPRVSDRYAGR